ncbi:MAG: hypothetical protein DSY92_03295 [Planctomycetota bacterium]|nr:MAG: hypothetical protein DSY92_03295 [Planctomycetota bacterium]
MRGRNGPRSMRCPPEDGFIFGARLLDCPILIGRVGGGVPCFIVIRRERVTRAILGGRIIGT